MNKKRVRYADVGRAVVGERAYVQPIDHPDVPKWEWVYTSTVVKVTLSPLIFETRNTLYVPAHVETDNRKQVLHAQPV